MASIARGTALVLLLASTFVIIVVTTMPWSYYYVGHGHWAAVEWIPFTRRIRPLDFVLNLLLFLPFGYSAMGVIGHASPAEIGASWRRRRYLPVLGACLLSMSVELYQVYCHGRMPTTTDVLSNALGAYLGTFIGRHRSPSPTS